jgi:hypothetical protein
MGENEISDVERAALADPAVRDAVAAARSGDRSELRTRPSPAFEVAAEREVLYVSEPEPPTAGTAEADETA